MSLQSCVGKTLFWSTDLKILTPESASFIQSFSEGSVIDISNIKNEYTEQDSITIESVFEFTGRDIGRLALISFKQIESGVEVFSIFEYDWFIANCETASPPTTTPDAGEDPPESLEEEPAPRVDEPCSPDADSNAPAQASGAIPSWGVNFEYLDASQTKQRWTLALLPAMQSNIRYTGGTDVPGALPGLSFRTIPSIARHKVPGFQPMYQHMGIDSVTVTMVGCFTGADGVEETLRPKFDNTNVVLLGSGGGDRRALIRQLDSYKSFQDFYRISVQQGRELTVELNLSGKFSAAEDTLGCTGLRNTRGNPQFKALVKRIDTYYARSDRTWYTLDLEITDYKLISDAPINLLPPEESSTDVLGTGDFTDSQSNSPVLSTPGREYRGQYYLWNQPIRDSISSRYLELRTANNGVIFEYEVSYIVADEVMGAGLHRYPPSALAVGDCSMAGQISYDVKESDGGSTINSKANYPCQILGRTGFWGGDRGSQEARIINAPSEGNPWGEGVYGLYKDDLRTPQGRITREIIGLVIEVIGCVGAITFATALTAAGGFVSVVTAGVAAPAAFALSAVIWAVALVSCKDIVGSLLRLIQIATGRLISRDADGYRDVLQYLSQEGEDRSWTSLLISAAVEFLPVEFLSRVPFIRKTLQGVGNLGFSRWILDSTPVQGALRMVGNFYANRQLSYSLIQLQKNLPDDLFKRFEAVFSTLDPADAGKVLNAFEGIPESAREDFLKTFVTAIEPLAEQGPISTRQVDELLDAMDIDPSDLSSTSTFTSTTSSVPSSVFNPTEIQKLEDFITTRFPNDPDLMYVAINTNSETVFIDSTNLNKLNSALNALEAGDEIDFIYPEGYSGFLALKIAVENLGLQYIEAGRFEVPNRATSPSAASSSPNVSTTGSASSTTTAPSNPSSPPTTSQAPEPTPRQASVNTSLVRGIPDLTGAEIDSIESALRAEADKLVVSLLGENNEIRDLSSIDRFIDDLRTQNFPDLGYWDFTYLRGQRPSREFINLMRSSGLQVVETRGPGLFRFQRSIQIYPYTYINPTSPRS